MSVRNGQITILIPGRGEQGFNFGMGAWYEFTKRQQIPVSGIFSVLRLDHPKYLEAIRDVLYTTACYHQELQKKEIDFTPVDVFSWIDDMPNEDFLKIIETMSE